MKRIGLLCSIVALSLFASCQKDDDYMYPSIITEMADIATDETGTMKTMHTDKGSKYQIQNSLTGYAKKVVYRAVCGYVPNQQYATIYQLQRVHILRDSTSVQTKDPIDVTSIWRGGKYINLQLKSLTQGGTQYWGFVVDEVSVGHTYVSLHHKQNADPTSYTQVVYASLPVDSLKTTNEGDEITIRVNTNKGEKTWTFRK